MTFVRFAGIVAPFIASVLGGCSGYQQFYRPVPGITPEVIARFRVSPPPATPIVERLQPASPEEIQKVYTRRGYVVIGHSSFNSGTSESDESAIEQGRAVGADLVLIMSPRYTGSVTTSVPITTPTTSTSYSSGTATAYGPGGPVTAYGSGTTTTYGSTTTYYPVTVHRTDYAAVYFIKRKWIFGANLRNLDDSERQELQTNRGAVVRVVVDGSPAYNADILPGDVIVAVGGAAVSDWASVGALLEPYRGREVQVSVLRRGQRIEKAVQLSQ
jgi:membrane-associated protease RseP (regulator of RpoE activity)